MNPPDIDVLVLCGGFGRRLRSVVSDRPKPLAEVAGKPFLEHLISWAAGFGFRRFVLCSGYKAGQVEAFAHGMNRDGLSVECSAEPEPLGTGGALRFALDRLSSDPVLVLNGDSFCDADLAAFLGFHSAKGARASLVLAPAPARTARYGSVEISETEEISSLREKAENAAGWINAGIYCVNRDVIESLAAGTPCSLEKDLFPSLTGKGLFGMRTEGRFVDIGVPEEFQRAQGMFSRIPKA